LRTFVLVAPLVLPLVLKTLLYVIVFRIRKHHVSLLTSIVLAGSPMIAGGLGLKLIHLPEFIQWLISIGITVFILAKTTEVDPLPEGFSIIIGIELTSAALLRFIIFPLLPHYHY
jgi:hypothetical protein